MPELKEIKTEEGGLASTIMQSMIMDAFKQKEEMKKELIKLKHPSLLKNSLFYDD